MQPPANIIDGAPEQPGLARVNVAAPVHLEPALPPDNVAAIAQLHQALQGLLALSQQQQAAINLLQQNVHGAQPPYHISIKLPPFSCNNPRLWFDQVEAQFRFYAVDDEPSRFAHIMRQLDEHSAQEIVDIIRTLPIYAPYTTMKAALIRRLATFEHQRVRQLLSGEELGDRTPSQFLRYLRSLSNTLPEQLLRAIWMQHLPKHVQAIVHSHSVNLGVTIDHLANIANGILEVSPSTSPVVTEISTTPTAVVNHPASPAPSPTMAAIIANSDTTSQS